MSEGLRPADPAAGASSTPEVPGYDLLGKLGQGGMGEVFLARQRSLDREVALKLVRNGGLAQEWFLERLEREARILARLRNPHLVTVHDFVRLADGSAAVVMERVEGGNLRDRLRRSPEGLPVDEAVSVVEQAGEALEAAHAQGVVHRDIKPENLLVDGAGRIRVSDFGMALSLAPDSPRLTRTGAAAGTPGYLAPEQVSGGRVDARTDVYALGVVLYELLTGRLPLGRFEPPGRLRPGIPGPLERVLLRALHPEPPKRPQTVSEFLAGLRGAENPVVDPASDREPPPVVPSPPEPETAQEVELGLGGRPESRIRTLPFSPRGPDLETDPEPPPPTSDGRSRRHMLLGLAGAVAVGVVVRLLRPGIRGGSALPRDDGRPWKPVPLPPDPAAVALSGTWRAEGDAVVSGGEVCLLPLMETMPPAWDLRLQVTRLGGVDSAAVFFLHPSGFGSAELDGWSRHRSGVQAVDGGTTAHSSGFDFELETGRTHELELSVRPDGVRMSVDGRGSRIYPLRGRRLSVVAPWEWPAAAPATALALGSYRSPMRFSRLRWTPAPDLVP